MTKRGVVKVADFGLGSVQAGVVKSLVVSGNIMTASGKSISGTLAYMSPEQLEGGKPSPADDIYALGIIACELLTGRRPSVANLARMLARVSAPSGVVDLVVRACEEPSDRFGSAKPMLEALDAVPEAAGLGVVTRPASSEAPRRTKAMRAKRDAGSVAAEPANQVGVPRDSGRLVLPPFGIPPALVDRTARAVERGRTKTRQLLGALFASMRDVLRASIPVHNRRAVALSIAGFGKFYVVRRSKRWSVSLREADHNRGLKQLLERVSVYGVSLAEEELQTVFDVIRKEARQTSGVTIRGFGNLAFRRKYGERQLWFLPSSKLRDYLNQRSVVRKPRHERKAGSSAKGGTSVRAKTARQAPKRFTCPGCGEHSTAASGVLCRKCDAFVHSQCMKQGRKIKGTMLGFRPATFELVCPVCGTRLGERKRHI